MTEENKEKTVEPQADPQLVREMLARGIDPVEQFYREQEQRQQREQQESATPAP